MTASRRERANRIRIALQDLRIELAVLTHRVAASAGLRETDLACLDALHRSGPMTPSQLATRVGVHIATMTGVLKRLEDARWIRRERHEADGRSVYVSIDAVRARRLERLFEDANDALARVSGRLRAREVDVVVSFLEGASSATRTVVSVDGAKKAAVVKRTTRGSTRGR